MIKHVITIATLAVIAAIFFLVETFPDTALRIGAILMTLFLVAGGYAVVYAFVSSFFEDDGDRWGYPDGD